MTSKKIKNNLSSYFLLSPAAVILLFVFAYQIVNLFVYSLFSWKGYELTNSFNNFQYFATLFSKNTIAIPLLRSFGIIIIVVPLVIFITTFITHNIYRKIAGWRFYLWIFFIPSVIPVVVAGITWRFLLNFNGPVNMLLRFLHLNFLVVDWFGNGKFALIALCWIIIWRELGFASIIFLAQLNSVDPCLYEAATLDGANEFQLIRHVTLPCLNNIIKFYTVMMTIYVLNNLFGVVLVTTNGGPGYSTTVLEYFIYFLAFRSGKIGLGSAVAVILFIITIVLVYIYVKLNRNKKGEDAF